jgi:hypothetical protein
MPISIVQDRMRTAFPPSTDLMTVRAVREGILLGDDLIKSSPILSNIIGHDYRGLIRRAGVMFSVHEFSKRGDLPFQTSFRRMHRGHWHLLEITSGNERAHICMTDEFDAFPEDTPVKQDERLVNQIDLFTETLPTETILQNIPRLYVWLTFGVDWRGTLTHVCWAAPAKTEKQWLAFENILRRATDDSGTPTQPVAPASPDPTSRLRFKADIEAALGKKNDEKSSA